MRVLWKVLGAGEVLRSPRSLRIQRILLERDASLPQIPLKLLENCDGAIINGFGNTGGKTVGLTGGTVTGVLGLRQQGSNVILGSMVPGIWVVVVVVVGIVVVVVQGSTIVGIVLLTICWSAKRTSGSP